MPPADRLRWWRQGEATQNFGDFLSSFLADTLFLPIGLDGTATHVIGSVIDDSFLREASAAAPVSFWGTGCRDAIGLSPELRPRARILAVRGPLTRAALGLDARTPMGDPAFLLPALLEPGPAPRTAGRSVVVPHVHDDRSDAELLAASGAQAVVRTAIPATHQALIAVIEELVAADIVLTASLHGAVVAMAWGVPFAFWESGRTDLPFKWADISALVGIDAWFSPDAASGRAWYDAEVRGRLCIPSHLEMVAAAPFLLRPDALLRIVRLEAARAGPVAVGEILDRAVALQVQGRTLVGAIAMSAAAELSASRQLARHEAVLADQVQDLRRALTEVEQELTEVEQDLTRARDAIVQHEATDAALRAEIAQLRLPQPPRAGRAMRVRRKVGIAWVNPLFDAAWYREHHPDVRVSRLGATAHYVRHGRAERRPPNERFDPAWYLAQNPDVADAGTDPVDHWWFHGAAEGRDPHPAFDTRWYVTAHPDVGATGTNPLLQWLRMGRSAGWPTQPPEPAASAAPAAEDGPAAQAEPVALGSETSDPMLLAATTPPAPPPATAALEVDASWPAGAVIPRRDPALADVPLVLDAVRMERDPGSVTMTCPIGDGRELWIQVEGPEAILARLGPRLEPFIPPAILLAGLEGRPVRVEAPLDARYERRLRHGLLPLIGGLTVDADVRLETSGGRAARPRPAPLETVGLLFSGGVDSMYALQRMQQDGWPPDMLININAGAHDLDRACWARRLDGIAAVAAELRVPLVTIDTNLHELAWAPHRVAHTFRNLAAVSVLQAAVGTLVYSPGHRLEVTSFPAAHEARADVVEPLTTEVMRWGGMELHLVGNDTGKAYKIASLAGMPLARRHLDICVDQPYQAAARPGDPVNCGRCFKCARAILVMEHLGILGRFAGCFDLVAFETAREPVLERIRTMPFHLENEARAVLAGPPGTLPPLVRGALPPGPMTADSIVDPAAAAAPHVPDLPAGAVRPMQDPSLAGVPIVLDEVTLEQGDGRARLTCAIGDGRSLWIEVAGPDDVLAALEPRLEPFIPPALLLGIAERRPVRIVPALEPTQARRLGALIPLMSALLSDRDVEVHRTVGLDVSPPPPSRVDRTALLFSGGVDSFYTLDRMTREGWPPDLLVNLNAGAHDLDRTCWQHRLERVRGVAGALGVPLITIDTNLHELGWVDHSRAHAFRNLAAASVLRPVIGTLAYSSGHRLEVTSLMDSHTQVQDLVEPLTADVMRWGGLDIALVGNDVRKIDKVAAIAGLPLAWRYLDVCTNQPYQAAAGPGAPANCGHCGKCPRTLLTLEHLGVLERFASGFDMDAFAARRAASLEHLMTRDHPIEDEFREMLTVPAGTLPPFTRGVLPPRSAPGALRTPVG